MSKASLWQSEELAGQKKHKEKITKLYDMLFDEISGFGGAKIEKLPPGPDRLDQQMVKISLSKSNSDLKRWQDLSSQKTYLFNKATGNVTPLDFIPQEQRAGVIASSTEPHFGKKQVRFRKGAENEKDIFAEVWSHEKDGFVSSLKVTSLFSKIYNDSIFGGMSWSPDGNKVAFVAEIPEVATYKPFYKDEEKKKETDENKDEDKKADDKKKKEPEHWQDEKFLYKENFGETLDSKSKPGIFIFDLVENQVERVHLGRHLDEDTNYCCDPIFDESSSGLVFSAINLPVKKLGLNFCLNKQTSLYYLRDPKFAKEDADKIQDGQYLQNLTKGEYMAMKPSFSRDYSRLAYFASTEKFVAHSSQYQLKSFEWPLKNAKSDPQAVTNIDYIKGYPKDQDEFCGIFGYQYSFAVSKFFGNSNRFFLFTSPFKGQDRAYIADLKNPLKKPLFINYLNQDSSELTGNHVLLSSKDDLMIFQYSSCNELPKAYVVQLSNLESAMGLQDIKFTPTVLAECKVQNESLASAIKSITKERVRLENGADASLMRMTGEHASQCPGKGQNGKYPMLTLIHGGPFGASPLDMLLIMRTFFILQGYCLLIVNYRGSTGYGKDFLDSLLGHIGLRDVEDCGDLTLKAVQQLPDVIDDKRLTVEGGSHGGFMTGWLIGHQKYKDLWAASSIWNGVLDMTYMVTSTDIPDWIWACCLNKELTDYYLYDAEDNMTFFKMSPISQIKNVTTPTLLVVGTHDYRVPPHQSYFYYNCLKSKQVPTKLYNYPDDGHGLLKKTEHSLDAYLNITFWLDEYAMKPHREDDEVEDDELFQWPPLESNPEVFTDYLTNIGLSKEWTIGEVFGFDEELLAFIPQPVVAVIVAFEGLKEREDHEKGNEKDVKAVDYYMKQTKRLDNACGIIACLHAIYNNVDQVKVEPDSVLDQFIKLASAKTPLEKAQELDKFVEFKKAHKSFADKGQSEAITKTGQDKQVRHHFIAFVVNQQKQLVLLDGLINGPLVIQENCDDVLRGSIKFVQQKLEEGKISDQLSMMTLNMAPQ